MAWRKWVESTAKDQSEIVKNIFTALAIVVGGGWALYQWDKLFPQTNAEVLSAASAIRTDVKGQLYIQLGDDGATTPSGLELIDCANNSDDSWILDVLVSGNAKLESASEIPIFAEFQQIEITEGENYVLRIIQPDRNRLAVRNIRFDPIGRAGPEVVMGGLTENRIEQGQSVQTSFLFALDLPRRCGSTQKLVTFRANYILRPIDPVSGVISRDVSVNKVLVSTCQIDGIGHGACNIASIEAYGQ